MQGAPHKANAVMQLVLAIVKFGITTSIPVTEELELEANSIKILIASSNFINEINEYFCPLIPVDVES